MDRNRIVVIAVIVALISLLVCYVGHVEYFKAFPIVFVIVGAFFALRGPSLPMQKVKSVGVYVILGGIMFLVAMVLWR